MTLRDKLSNRASQIKKVKIKCISTDVWFRKLTVRELHDNKIDESDSIGNAVYMIGHSLCDEKGVRCYSDDEFDLIYAFDQDLFAELSEKMVEFMGLDVDEHIKK